MESAGTKRTLRKRETVSRKEEDTSQPCELTKSWSESERECLLMALKKHGCVNMEALKEAVPTQNEYAIRQFINSAWKHSRYELSKNSKGDALLKENSLAPLDKWLEIINSYFSKYDFYKNTPLARAFLYIYKYGNLPDPSKCGGVNFRDLYQYLHYVLCGYPPKELDQVTAAFLLDTMSRFVSKTKSTDFKNEFDFIKSLRKVPYSEQSTPQDTDGPKLTKEQSFTEFLNIPGANVFNVRKSMLQKEKTDN